MGDNAQGILRSKDYTKNADGSFNIDWYDLKGKSIPRLKWDEAYWKAIATGSNKENRYEARIRKKYLPIFDNDVGQWWTNPSRAERRKKRKINHYMHLMNKHSPDQVKSWLQKYHYAQFQQNWYQKGINAWWPYRFTGRVKKRDLNHYIKERDKYKKLVKQYGKHKDAALARSRMYRNAWTNRIRRARQAKLDKAIAAQVKANTANNLTSIYRADHQDSTVIAVSELSPTETVSMNLPSHSVDKDLPETDFANVSEEQLSGTYYAFLRPGVNDDSGYGEANSPSYADRVKQYKTLVDWSKHHRVVVRGFSYWSSTSIASISKTMDPTGAANSLQMSITFQYQRVATIATAKQKANTSKRRGRARRKNPGRRKTYKVKPNDNLYNIAHGNVKKLHAIEKANPKIKNPNLIYPGQKVVLPK